MIRRTETSRKAQEKLKKKLKAALDSEKKKKIVMIAYSQGCLLLRLVLREFIQNAEPDFIKKMKAKLRIFTFGNPCTNWNCGNNNMNNIKNLDEYACRTEHIANRADFVAKLGVVRPANTQYDKSHLFINEKWIGHQFGSQYSLDAIDYGIQTDDPAERRSQLLDVIGSKPIE